MKSIQKHPSELIIAVKGAGDLASGIACQLFRANIRQIFMMEIRAPMAVRRQVSFCEAIHDGHQTVEGIQAIKAGDQKGIFQAWQNDQIAVICDPEWRMIENLRPDVVIDAILAKKNLGTKRSEALLVIGLGPGFKAGKDVDIVIETQRGHDLGRVIHNGSAAENTGIPGSVGGFTHERVLRAMCDGPFDSCLSIGATVQVGDEIGAIKGQSVRAQISGVLRGLIRPDSQVTKGMKIGDIDPRGRTGYCHTISDKARTLGGSVLEAVLSRINQCCTSLSRALGLTGRGVVSVIGAGGKTSLMFRLAHELEQQGKRVLTTTTTKIFIPTKNESPVTIAAESIDDFFQQAASVIDTVIHVSAGQRMDQKSGKLVGIPPEWIDQIWKTRLFDVIIVEADGAKQYPIKASAMHEPVIPLATTHLIHVTGLDALNMPVDEAHVHRPELLLERLNLRPGDLLNEDHMAASIVCEIQKADQLAHSLVNIVALNKADDTNRYFQGLDVTNRLKNNPLIDRAVILSLKDKACVKVCH